MWGWIGVAVLLGAGAPQGGTAPDAAPKSLGWLSVVLKDGAELRYVPVAVTFKDYPRKARESAHEGTSLLKLQLDASGLKECSTARSSGSLELDEQACRLYRQRGRFELRGTSQSVTVHAPVRWVIED